MELLSEVITTPPRHASSVVLLREGAQGPEVFLVKRHGLSDVLGGAYVFPGGKLDDSDAQLDAATRLDQSAQAMHQALAEPETPVDVACGLYVAALREAFEESGVLFAEGATPQHSLQALQLLKEGLDFNTMLERLQLRLQTRAVQPWSRWITPKLASVSAKRFDTRFFVAALPDGQVAQHDNFEATESTWLTPRAALEQYWDRQIELAPPQIMGLSHLTRYASVAQALQEARRTPPPLIEPQPFDRDGERVLTYPGDPRHSEPRRALPGPTRLVHRNRRFEPEDGFQALLLR